jgi:hypothetical protein
MDGVVGSDNQHQVVDVRLGVSSGTIGTVKVVARNHTRIYRRIGIVDAFHVACQEPRNDKCYHWQYD